MIDPISVAELAAAAPALARLAGPVADVWRLHAATRFVRAVAALPPGTEIRGAGRDGSRWLVRVPPAAEVRSAR
jgi:hypothetical protein